ncbi:MAG: hypothetical protein IPG43_06295 [Proteobacteria bacterium]|nr:hypothetical protein [Pseudomonadota bacterium]
MVHEAMDAGMMGWSCQRFGKNSMQADYDGTPMPTDVMPDETLLALADVLADRGEGFIEMINATTGEPLKTNDPKDSKFVEEIARRSGRPVLYNAIIAMDAPGYETAHHAALKWLDECFADGKRIYGQAVTVRAAYQFTLEHWNLYDSSPAWNELDAGSIAERIDKMRSADMRGRQIADEEILVTTGVSGPISGLIVQETPIIRSSHTIADARSADCGGGGQASHRGHALDIGIAGSLKVLFRTNELSSTDTKKVGELVRNQHIMPGISDGSAHTKFFTGGFTTRHDHLAGARDR